MTVPIKTTAILLRPFRLPSFDETLPPGEYEIETRLLEPVNWIEPGTWMSSVLVHLHPRASHPGLSRTLTVPLAELENAVARDKLTGKALTEYLLEEMLADPMIRLVMQADGWDEAEVRDLHSARPQADRESLRETGHAAVPCRGKKTVDTGPSAEGERPGTKE